MLVCGQDFDGEKLSGIQGMIRVSPGLSRRRLSLRVCDWLNWKSPNGKLKEMTCRVALLKLERRGLMELPPPHSWGNGEAAGKDPEAPGWEMRPVRGSLEELGRIELVRIDNPRSAVSQVWKALMKTHHYLGDGPLCGAQMRYLIKSDRYGWLGGLAFSAAAWRLGPRDRWIGWSEQARKENLNRVVCNSRFLIPRQVQVPNLASHVLALSAKRLAGDWAERYGFAPLLLETFVDRGRFKGTSYRAANWQCVGKTQGRGRQDRERACLKQIKDIYVYPLSGDAGPELCSTTFPNAVKSEKSKEAVAKDWPEAELGRAGLGDQRLERRLVSILRDFYARPQASIPQACQSRAKAKAAYRFLEHPDMTLDKVLKPHYEATLERLQGEKIILVVQDTTSLNYTTHPATANLGSISYHQNHTLGLILHDTLAFNPAGLPLGLVDVQCWARDEKALGQRKHRNLVPIEQKESRKWLASFRKTAEFQKRCPGSTLVSLSDREADIYELFELAAKEAAAGGPALVVRAKHDRLLGEGQGHLWEKVSGQTVSGIQEVKIPRRGDRPARTAKLEVRFAQVVLKPPEEKRGRDLTIWAVLGRETDTPAGLEPVEWMLLTTMQVSAFEQAVEKLRWYTVRWSIEVYHRTLKSGCKIEERQLGTADRIETCLAIDMVVAWRIVHLTKLGRDTPDVPCTVYFEEAEWKALTAYVTRNPVSPEHPPTLHEATCMVATLGGFLGRKGDGEPGAESLWIGLQHLDDITEMWKIMTAKNVPHPKKRIVSSNPEYG
jgi:hypothetical protein